MHTAVEQRAEVLAVQERELAEHKASLHNQQEQLREEQILLQEASTAAEQDRHQAQDMLKVQIQIVTISNGTAYFPP